MSDDQEDILTATRREVFAAIVLIKEEVGILVKDERNKFAGFKYSGIDQYYEKVAPIALKHGIHWVVNIDELSRVKTDEDQNDVYLAKVSVDLNYKNGISLRGYQKFSMEHPIIGPQSAGSIASYAEKIFMRTVFKIPSGEPDADGIDNRQATRWQNPAQYQGRGGQVATRHPDDREALLKNVEQDLKGAIPAIGTATDLEKLWRNNVVALAALKVRDSVAYERVAQAFKDRKAELVPKALPSPDALPAPVLVDPEPTPSQPKSKWVSGRRAPRTVAYPKREPNGPAAN